MEESPRVTLDREERPSIVPSVEVEMSCSMKHEWGGWAVIVAMMAKMTFYMGLANLTLSHWIEQSVFSGHLI